jgi:protein-tyrosine phosphatase
MTSVACDVPAASMFAPAVVILDETASGGGLLLLGPEPASLTEWDLLLSASGFNVTRVVRCLAQAMDEAVRAKISAATHIVPIHDIVAESIVPHVASTCDFIEAALQQSRSCFVHCSAGVSRSVSIVLAFLIVKKGMPLAAAYAHVRERRPCARPNYAFMEQLAQLELRGRGENEMLSSASSLSVDEYVFEGFLSRFKSLLGAAELRALFVAHKMPRNPALMQRYVFEYRAAREAAVAAVAEKDEVDVAK